MDAQDNQDGTLLYETLIRPMFRRRLCSYKPVLRATLTE